MAPMALNGCVSARSSKDDAPTLSQIAEHCDAVLDKLYRVDEHKRTRYKKFMQKYIDMNATTTNPHINSAENTTYYTENEPEHRKNSKNLYKNNTHKVEKK
jgi:DNA-binding transcriptional regulator YbjK